MFPPKIALPAMVAHALQVCTPTASLHQQLIWCDKDTQPQQLCAQVHGVSLDKDKDDGALPVASMEACFPGQVLGHLPENAQRYFLVAQVRTVSK